jgi:hypothetical protein
MLFVAIFTILCYAACAEAEQGQGALHPLYESPLLHFPRCGREQYNMKNV